MKNVLSILAFLLFGIFLAAGPARAQESAVSFMYQERVQGEGYLAAIQAVRAPNVAVSEEMFLVNWNVSPDFSLTFDVWNTEAIEERNNSAIRRAVHETDLELEGTWHDALNEWDFRVKAAVYEISGPEIYSVRFAADHPIGEHCTGTGSLELMQGAFDFEIWQANVVCSGTWRGWTGTAEAGVASNTLNELTTVPFMLRATYGNTVSIGPYIRGYAGESSRATLGLQVVLRH